ncbi:GIY-YIG nuclease family protein [Gammaproteobacteria bacterium]|nr:GIY-YIG nuclease family protein [Gammaproteobacteria bacterium]
MNMITFFDILMLKNIDPKGLKLVRHSNKEIPVVETFHKNRSKFEAYQGFQTPRKYGSAKQIAVFAPDRGTRTLFLGLWDIHSYQTNAELKPKHHRLIRKYAFPERWIEHACWYDLRYNTAMEDLSERLIVDWGGATISWVQSRNKNMIAIKEQGALRDFISYDDVQLSYSEIQKLTKTSAANHSWIKALSVVNGIYVIKDTATGYLYVGSSYGADGICGRWAAYAQSGHGGNKMLKDFDPSTFEFSILEIVPRTMSADEVIAREKRWKDKLGTREHGLNLN